MLDILGREVSIGDVIVYGQCNIVGKFNTFSTTKFGIVKGISKSHKIKIPIKQWMPNLGNTVTYQEHTTIDKVLFFPLASHVIYPGNVRLSKHGKRLQRPMMTNNFLIFRDELPKELKDIYDEIRIQFKI